MIIDQVALNNTIMELKDIIKTLLFSHFFFLFTRECIADESNTQAQQVHKQHQGQGAALEG